MAPSSFSLLTLRLALKGSGRWEIEGTYLSTEYMCTLGHHLSSSTPYLKPRYLGIRYGGSQGSALLGLDFVGT